MIQPDLFSHKTAEFSPCRQYRYALWRWWNQKKPYCMFICLNPSTADETTDDNTVRRCIDFARRWGYGGLCMANLFAIRATHPEDMLVHPEPIGPHNDLWLTELAKGAGVVVAAWGNLGEHLDRAKHVVSMLGVLQCLGMTKMQFPVHPLYQPKTSKYQPFTIMGGADGEG